jgi:hypothetical protein
VLLEISPWAFLSTLERGREIESEKDYRESERVCVRETLSTVERERERERLCELEREIE